MLNIIYKQTVTHYFVPEFPNPSLLKKNRYSTKTGEPWIHGEKEHGS